MSGSSPAPIQGESSPGSEFANGQFKRIGVLGGTFDPIHIGHLILAVEAWYQLALDQVFLMPVGDPPHKQDRAVSSVSHRLQMCRLVAARDHALSVSRIDADRPAPHYTSDMLRLLRQETGPDTKIFFLMGLDSLRDLPIWHEPGWLVENCQLVALQRHDVEIDWPALEEALPGVRERVIILDMPELELSSSHLRERVRTGQPIRYQVPEEVAAYIDAQKLYRS